MDAAINWACFGPNFCCWIFELENNFFDEPNFEQFSSNKNFRHILRHPEGPPGDPTNPAKPVLLMANKIDWGQRPTWMGKWKTYSVYPCYKTHSSSWTRWPSFKVPRTRTPEKMLPSVKDESMSFISKSVIGHSAFLIPKINAQGTLR